MKYFFSFVLLLTTAFVEAQIVNIPDSNFKYLLISKGIDLNHDGQIQVSEALAVSQLSIHEALDYDLNHIVTNTSGLKEFKNLQSLTYFNRSPVMDLSNLTKLVTLNFSAMVRASENFPTTVDISNCTSLQSFYANNGADITSLNMTGCSSIKQANLSGTRMQYFNPGILDSLISLEMTNNYNVQIDLTSCKNLETFHCQNGVVMESLNLSGLKKLKNLVLYNSNQLKTVNFSYCESLEEYQNYLTYSLEKINVTGCKSLRSLLVSSTNIDSIDLSTCLNLKTFYCQTTDSRSKIKYVNLKNGSRLNEFALTMADSAMVCADEFEIDELRTIIERYNRDNFTGQPYPFTINSYCTMVPGGRYNTVKGNVRFDLNNNGCDSTDAASIYVPVRIIDSASNITVNYTNTNGDYVHYPYKGNFTIAPYFPYAFYSLNPSTSVASFDTANNLISINNFCILPNGSHNDLDVSFVPTWPPARPGFDPSYVLVYKNRGTTTLSGNVQLNYDGNKMTVVNTSAMPGTQTTTQLQWNYTNLRPFESRCINVTFHLLPPPVNNNNDTLFYFASITPSANDATPYDNSFILPQLIQGSFDPNDKQCLQGDKIDLSAIGQYLDYVIHFQNLGTDTAFNIVVADTLSNRFDWNSFEFTGSSHPCSVKRNDNKLEFFFNDIQLPYKAINEPGSNGFIAFKIKPASTTLLGDSLNNSAAIYFDFNQPVVTNLATTIVSNVSTPVAIRLEYFTATASGTNNVLRWKATCTVNEPSFVIERSSDGSHFTTVGNITSSTDRCRLPYQFTDNNPVAGKNYYRIKMTDVAGVTTTSPVLLVSNKKLNFSITAIAGNAVYFNSVKSQKVTVQVLAADGKLLYNTAKIVSDGNGYLNLPLDNYPSGVYTLLLVSDDGTATRKFVR